MSQTAAAPSLHRRNIALPPSAVREMKPDEDKDEVRIFGYGLKWGERYEVSSWLTESFVKGAFPDSAREDVRLLRGHGGEPLARSSRGTMRTWEDDDGLGFEARLDLRDSEARDLMVKIERGDLDGMSVGFSAGGPDTRFDYVDLGGDHWELIYKRIDRLWEISAVTFPAYETSEVALRSLPGFEDLEKRRNDIVEEARRGIEKEVLRRGERRARIETLRLDLSRSRFSQGG